MDLRLATFLHCAPNGDCLLFSRGMGMATSRFGDGSIASS